MPEPLKTVAADSFIDRLRACGAYPLHAASVRILQLNITRRCNLSCKHCHIQAGPWRMEIMPRATMAHCIRAAANDEVTTVDITGGAPELHPGIEWLVQQLAALGKRLLVRSNLLILLEPAYRHLMEFFAGNQVELVGSLPDYRAERTDRQRGTGTFKRAIEAMRELNRIGYGMSGSGLKLDLVHNPAGAYLPGPQAALEAEYRRRLGDEFGVSFNALFCLVNCPIGRYLDYLTASGNLPDYLHALKGAFNIVVRSHCFACTAGAGSSCQGSLTPDTV